MKKLPSLCFTSFCSITALAIASGDAHAQAVTTASTGSTAAATGESEQPTETAAQSAQAQPQRDSEDEEILVTARRVEERLEQVPVATSVLTAADQANLVLDNLQDYLRQTPGALIVNAGPDYFNEPSIRGQGGGRNGFSESAAGIYRNGIYVAGGGFGGRGFNRLDYFDNERVEVFRGPQGALYGRSAVGGAINVVSRRPQYEAGAWIEGEYTDAERTTMQGVVNVPLGPQTAVRTGGFVISQKGGDILDVNTGRILDQQDYRGFRAMLRQGFADTWEARLTYEYYSSDAPSFSSLGQRVNPPAPGRVVDPGPFLRNASFPSFVDIEENTWFAELDGDLGFANLALVYAHKERDAGRRDDLDHFTGLEGIPGVSILVDQTEDYSRDGVELRLSSNRPDLPLTWLVGADYQTYDDLVITNNSGTAPANAAFGVRNQVALRNRSVEELRSWSVFGLLDYRFTEQFSASVEARYQQDEKEFNFQQTSLNPAINQSAAPQWERFLPAATLSYRVTPNQTLYARFASAYRPGGFNQGVTDLNFLSYDPETTYAVEAGFKGRIPSLRMRFELVGYHNWNKDMQLVTAASATDTTTTLQNAGDARLYGLEAQLGGRVSIGSGFLNYNIGAATQNGEFSDGATIIIQGRRVDLSGVRVNRTRDLILNVSSFYNVPVGRDATFFFGGSLRMERGGFENATGGSADPSGRPLEDYEIVDGRIGFRGDGWSISAFVKNAFDETYVLSQILNNNYYNERRRFGVEFRIGFGSER